MNTPQKNLVTSGCCPIATPSMCSCIIKIAVFIVRYCLPTSNCSKRKSSTVFKGAENGQMPRPVHQLSHCLRAHEYETSVECRQDLLSISITLFKSPLLLYDFPRHAKRLEVGVLGGLGGEARPGVPGQCSVCWEVVQVSPPACLQVWGTRSVFAKLQEL